MCSFTILSASTAFRMLRSSLFLELFPTGASGILKQVKLGLFSLFFAGSAGCKVNYVKACVSGGGGCLRTSAVQRKLVRLTILLRIRTWWNQGLFYWYEEWFISDIIQLCYEIQGICFEISTKFFSTFPEFTSRQSKNQGRRKNKIFIKKQTKKKNQQFL